MACSWTCLWLHLQTTEGCSTLASAAFAVLIGLGVSSVEKEFTKTKILTFVSNVVNLCAHDLCHILQLRLNVF